MPVKEFIPVEDAKLTIEKEVKPKLTTAELTTIESPGRPVPASQLESPKKKKTRTKTALKKEPQSISPVKKDSILIGVGMHKGEDGKFHGDFNEEEIQNIVSYYSPTPGGVGPINVSMLLSNLVEASEDILEK